MSYYKERIIKYIEDIDNAVDIMLQDKLKMIEQISVLTAENAQLKEAVRDMMTDIDKYILELEQIRKEHVSSNSSN